ncbi:hypothetical protein [Lysobacter brunescens]|uniref:Uncharacterized protein n=1 Tax=Lysobacter brunescens TaxID=262323 RepID=A0ABW2YD41_9GAMM
MNPGRVFAVVILLLAGALLLQGYLVPALLLAVFGVLVFAAQHVRRGASNDEGVIGDVGASSWSSGSGDRGYGDDRSDDRCDPGDDGGDSGDSGDSSCDGGGDGGGGD